ncbi:hypothetical protein [Helicobacter pylori]|uniref:hypothetical protein n=1 Tax=Helicobacter pylori TaxID=210 RepID=UPI000EB57B38|nr:hypothetical protein [Helicobacter pylori]
MSKIKPQIKKNNPSKSHYSTGWNVFGAVGLIWRNVADIIRWESVGIRKIRKNNQELFKNLTL